MDPEYLHALLEKYHAGKCTPAELEQLNNWYASLGSDRPDHLLDPDSEAARQLTQRSLQGLRERLSREAAPAPDVVTMPLWRKALRWAAVLAGIALVVAGVYRLRQPAAEERRQTVAQLDHSRYIILPDSSTVILHAGSRLDYPAAFTGPVREVSLSGEAYFDIRHNSRQGFVIRTGKLKTTVLGTAFNIKAYPDAPEITVSVTRGKVQVEDGEKVLAVLTPDQQVVYNTAAAVAERQPVNAAAQASWTRQDMVFEHVTFEAVAAALSKRYQVNIRFGTEALKHCPVRVSFNGTESLETVLEVLCTIRNANYSIANEGEIIIDGKGCPSDTDEQ